MNKPKFFVLLIICALFCTVLLSCANDPGTAGLQGEWRRESYMNKASDAMANVTGDAFKMTMPETIKFSGNGIVTAQNMGKTMEGEWSKNGDSVTVVMNDMTVEGVLKGSSLVMSDGNAMAVYVK